MLSGEKWGGSEVGMHVVGSRRRMAEFGRGEGRDVSSFSVSMQDSHDAKDPP